ncbi:MAG: hypothetical protein ACXVKP_14065, partial [Ilumatobacteraceae bacterium]
IYVVVVAWSCQLLSALAIVHQWWHMVWVLQAATWVAWVATGVAGLRAVWIVASDHPFRSGVRAISKALGVQRFQVVVVAILVLLFLVPGAPILEQGTDVVRSWVLDGDWTSARWGVGLFLVLAGVLRYLSSIRVAPRVALGGSVDVPTSESLGSLKRLTIEALQWAIGGAGGFALLTVLLDRVADVHVDWLVAMWAVIVLATVPVVGVLVRAFPLTVEVKEPGDDAQARRRALLVGRVVSAMVPVVLFVSVCRSMFAPWMIGVASSGTCIATIGVCALIAAAIAGVAVAWPEPVERDKPSLPGVLSQFEPQMVGAKRPTKAAVAAAEVKRVPGWIVSMAPSLSVMAGCALLLVWLPMWTSRTIGLVGTVALCLLMLTAFFTALLVASQIVDPPYVFRAMGLTRTPVVEIALTIALLATLFGTGSPLHALREGRTAGAVAASPTMQVGSMAEVLDTDPRPKLPAVLDEWVTSMRGLDAAWSCAISVPSTSSDQPSAPTSSTSATTAVPAPTTPRVRKVQPLVLVAAEGGGIRAARWTVDAMSVLTATDCGRRSLFLASGVSGGAVGLGLMASIRTPAPQPVTDGQSRSALTDAGSPYAAVTEMAQQDGLSAGVLGLLSRDLIAGAFGLRVDPIDVPDDVAQLPDRAALIEYAWERKIAGFDASFPIVSTATQPLVPWRTVFNGTSVGFGCRVLLTDVQLIDRGVNDCDAPGNPIPGAYDLFLRHPCYLGLPTSSASLAAARFPYVTPSAVIEQSCGESGFADQVIDGGYAENSGIDTANAVMAQLMPSIRSFNASALATAGDGVLIVPVVIFLHKTVEAAADATKVGGQPDAPSPIVGANPSAEMGVPVFNSGAGATLGDTATLLAHSTVIASSWLPDICVAPPGNNAATTTTSAPEVSSCGAVLPDGTVGLATTQIQHEVSSVLPSLTMTVAPQQKPQLALPLGWSMSDVTEQTMDDALNDYLSSTSSATAAFTQLLVGWHTNLTFVPKGK